MGYHARRMLRLAQREIGEVQWGTNRLRWALGRELPARVRSLNSDTLAPKVALLRVGEIVSPGQIDAEAQVPVGASHGIDSRRTPGKDRRLARQIECGGQKGRLAERRLVGVTRRARKRTPLNKQR